MGRKPAFGRKPALGHKRRHWEPDPHPSEMKNEPIGMLPDGTLNVVQAGDPPFEPRIIPDSDTQTDRIARAIARAGLTSRRDAEDWIAAGRVAINGETITSPARNVTAWDAITVDGAPLPQRERTRLFLYHKPAGLVTTNHDPQGRATIFDRLPADLPRLLTVGRLDIGTEGLLLLTNDGGLARVLELPDTGWLRRYRVRANGKVTQAQLDGLRDGVTVDGIDYGPIEATLDREQGANVWITFAIREGKNREVRNVMTHLDLLVNRLIRVSFGPFQLGELGEGAIDEVRTRVLRDQLGERVAQEAGCDFGLPVRPPQPPRREWQASSGPASERASAARGERKPHERERDRPRTSERDRSEPAERSGAWADHPGSAAPRPDAPGRTENRTRGTAPERHREVRGDDRKPPFRRDRRERDDRPERPEGRPRRGNAWRSEDAPLRTHYRGDRERREAAPDAPTGEARRGLLQDRKGRNVLVERFGAKPDDKAGRKRPHGQRDRAPARGGRDVAVGEPGRRPSVGDKGGRPQRFGKADGAHGRDRSFGDKARPAFGKSDRPHFRGGRDAASGEQGRRPSAGEKRGRPQRFDRTNNERGRERSFGDKTRPAFDKRDRPHFRGGRDAAAGEQARRSSAGEKRGPPQRFGKTDGDRGRERSFGDKTRPALDKRDRPHFRGGRDAASGEQGRRPPAGEKRGAPQRVGKMDGDRGRERSFGEKTRPAFGKTGRPAFGKPGKPAFGKGARVAPGAQGRPRTDKPGGKRPFRGPPKGGPRGPRPGGPGRPGGNRRPSRPK